MELLNYRWRRFPGSGQSFIHYAAHREQFIRRTIGSCADKSGGRAQIRHRIDTAHRVEAQPSFGPVIVAGNHPHASQPNRAEAGRKITECPDSPDGLAGKRRCRCALSCDPFHRRHLPALRRRVFRPDRLHQVSSAQLRSLVPQKRWPWRPPLLFPPLQDESVSATGRSLNASGRCTVIVSWPFRSDGCCEWCPGKSFQIPVPLGHGHGTSGALQIASGGTPKRC